MLAEIKLAEGDPVAAQSLLEQVPLDLVQRQRSGRLDSGSSLLRDYDAANRVIAATPAKWADVLVRATSGSWADGQVALARGDKQKAQSVFAAARKRWTRRGEQDQG